MTVAAACGRPDPSVEFSFDVTLDDLYVNFHLFFTKGLMMLRPLLVALAAIHAVQVDAAVLLSQPSYTQNFDSLANTGTSSQLPAGWLIAEGGTSGNATYAAGNGSSSTANTYSFGDTNSTERALGALTGNTLTPRFGVQITNNLGATITDLQISYFGELWREGSANLGRLAFSYALDATSLTTGTYTNVTSLNYNLSLFGTQGARNGNLLRTPITGTLSGLAIAQGSSVYLRWIGVNFGGDDYGMAIDDLSVTATVLPAVPEPASWALLIAGFGLIGAAMRVHRQRAPA